MNRSLRPTAGLALAVAVYIGLRALILISDFDNTAMPAYELYMIGTLSRQLLGDGGGMPMQFYYDNAAGPVALSYMGAVIYKLCGASYFSLKLVAGLLNLGALVLVWAFLKRLFSTRAADLGALLFAVGPATLVKYTLFTGGNHSENLVFTMATLVSFLLMHQAGITPRRLLATGLAAGFAIFIFLGAIIPVGILGLTHWGLRGWRRTLRDAPWGGAGLVLGLAPLIAVNLILGSRGASFLSAKFEGSGTALDWPTVAARMGEFLGVHLPNSSTYFDFLGLPGAFADWGFLGAYVLAAAFILPATLRSIAALVRGAFGQGDEQEGALSRALLAGLLLYLPLTGLAYALSDLRIGEHAPPMQSAGYRYFLPQLTFAILVIASQVAPRVPRLGSAAPVSLALLLGLFNLSLVDWSFEHAGAGFHYDGYNIKQNSRSLLHAKNALTDEEIVDYAEAFSPLFRTRVYYGLGFYSAFTARGELDPVAQSARFPAQRRGDVARGLGTFLRHNTAEPGVLLPDRVALIEAWIVAGTPHVDEVIEGLCAKWPVQLSNDIELLLDENERLIASSPAALRPGLARGHGLECGRLMSRGLTWEIASIEARLGRLPPDLRRSFDAGVGAGLVDGSDRSALGAEALALARTLERAVLLSGARARAVEIWGLARARDVVAELEVALGS